MKEIFALSIYKCIFNYSALYIFQKVCLCMALHSKVNSQNSDMINAKPFVITNYALIVYSVQWVKKYLVL